MRESVHVPGSSVLNANYSVSVRQKYTAGSILPGSYVLRAIFSVKQVIQ